MLKFFLLTAILLVLLFVIKISVTSFGNKENTEDNQKSSLPAKYPVKLQVYYETLCPDSVRFLVHQLEPLFTSNNLLWKQLVKVELIPYGKAHTTKVGISSYRFYCQHGSRECEGNRLHSCAIQYYRLFNTEFETILHFVTCTMKIFNSGNRGQGVNLYPCIQTNENSSVLAMIFKRIMHCYRSKEGDELLMKHGKHTHSLQPKLTFVPWIVLNEKYSYDVQTKSLHDLKGVLCTFLNQDRISYTNSSFTEELEEVCGW